MILPVTVGCTLTLFVIFSGLIAKLNAVLESWTRVQTLNERLLKSNDELMDTNDRLLANLEKVVAQLAESQLIRNKSLERP
jgi:hypothetical protein